MDQWLGLTDSCGKMKAQRKQLISQKEKGNMMTHFCSMDLLVVVKTEWKNLFA